MAFSMNASNRAPMSEINVTPLVDVMLVLLIIFMVTAPMMQEGLNLEVPKAKGEPLNVEPKGENIVITVSGQGEILVNEKPVPEKDLPETILQATKSKPDQEVLLRADKGVPYGTVVRIIGALSEAGAPKLGLITAPQEESKPER